MASRQHDPPGGSGWGPTSEPPACIRTTLIDGAGRLHSPRYDKFLKLMPEDRAKEGVFITHIAEEAPVARALKTFIQAVLGHDLPVFVSSDYESIPTGDRPFETILGGLKSAHAVLILLSRYSVERRWVNFEAGFGLASGSRIIPLVFRGLQQNVGQPLSEFQVRELADPEVLREVISSIAQKTRRAVPDFDPGPFVGEIRNLEKTLPFKGVRLEPFLSSAAGHQLKFRIRNTGNQSAQLAEAEVMVPKILLAPSFQAPALPPVRDRIYGTIDHQDALGYRYKVLSGHNPTPLDPLPGIFTPSMTPRVLEAISIPLRELRDLAEYRIRYKLCSPDFPSEDQYVLLKDLNYE